MKMIEEKKTNSEKESKKKGGVFGLIFSRLYLIFIAKESNNNSSELGEKMKESPQKNGAEINGDRK